MLRKSSVDICEREKRDIFRLAKFSPPAAQSLLGEWVLVSPHRTQRPWLGKVDQIVPPSGLQIRPFLLFVPW
jgi:hypothetical protein